MKGVRAFFFGVVLLVCLALVVSCQKKEEATGPTEKAAGYGEQPVEHLEKAGGYGEQAVEHMEKAPGYGEQAVKEIAEEAPGYGK